MSAIAICERLQPITLADTMEAADLQTRTDRKYVVDEAVLAALVRHLGDTVQVLDIDGLRRFGYQSVYFDSPDLQSYLAAARSRRNRWKVRTRTYLDSNHCVLEVKVKSGRGQTVKHRIDYATADRARLTDNGRAFVAELVDMPLAGRELQPVLTTSYRRTTLVGDAVRLTVDADFECVRADGARTGMPGALIVETKSAGPATIADRLLWALGCRPVSFSKYAVGMAALDPSLPANKWNKVLRRHLGRGERGNDPHPIERIL